MSQFNSRVGTGAEITQSMNDATDIYRRPFDPQTESASGALLTAVASIDGRELLDLPALYDAIDPEALDGVVVPQPNGRAREADCTVSFRYAGYDVSIDSDGILTLAESTDGESE